MYYAFGRVFLTAGIRLSGKIAKQNTNTRVSQISATTALTVACRMLAAANAAYYILGPTGAFTPPAPGIDPIYDSILWAAGSPQAIFAAPIEGEDIDACLVGKTTDGLTIVAFRGTLQLGKSPSWEDILDWVQDVLLSEPYNGDSIVQSWGASVMVHPGWWDSVVNITPQLNDALAGIAVTAPLYFTGHSKGGAMASLAAMQYHVNTNPSGPAPVVYTYASPHPGNQDFATAFSKAGLSQTRYENYIDAVPLFPPTPQVVTSMIDDIGLLEAAKKIDAIWASVLKGLLKWVSTWNYDAVGSGSYINQNGEIVTLNTLFQWEDLKGALEADNTSGIAAAHCASCPASGCDGGYMTGVCQGTGLCGS
jgi:hypothetical protein